MPPKPAGEDLRQDALYPAVTRAVAEILKAGDVVAPVEVFVATGRLTRTSIEEWRFGRIPFLERVVAGNLSKASRILRVLNLHARDLNLRPSRTVYMRWGKGPRVKLRFSKTGDSGVEAAYSTHFIRKRNPCEHRETASASSIP